MKNHSYTLFLASSCLALVLAAPLPLLGMESEESELVSIPVAASAPVQKPVQEDSWKDSLYAFPEIQAGFRMDVFNRLLFTTEFKDPKKQAALFECLEQAAFERMNPKALEKVKQFSTRQVLDINRINAKKVQKADNLLREFSTSKKNVELKGEGYGEWLSQQGRKYQKGLGVKKNPNLARQFFLKSLEFDTQIRVLVALGRLYLDEASSIPQNRTIAQLLWEKAEAAGHIAACANLATLHWEAQNFSKAIEYYEKASKAGDRMSTINLATLYYSGKVVKKDHARALEYFLMYFNKKESGVQEKYECAEPIGSIYYAGLPEMPPNYREALRFFKDADTNNLNVQYKIALCYQQLKDQKKAFQWWLRAAQQDDPQALLLVGYRYATAAGKKRNITQAKNAFKRAVETLKSRTTELSEEEKKLAQISLFNYGTLIKKTDRNTARIYMIQAAERGYTPAMLALARDYLHTQTPEALAKAFFWLKKAQELNDSDAQALFEAATKMGQEGEEASKDDKNLAECMETVEQPKVIDSLAFGSLSTPFEVADFPASVSASSPDSPHGSSASSDSSEGEETEPTTAEDYTISPQEIEQWQAEEAKWKEDIKNPKFVRERLQQAQKDFQNKQEVKEKPPLSSASTKTIETLRDKGVRFQITIDNLLSLFKDPYFQGQVDMFKTTDGYAIVGYNFLTGEAKSTGTHRKHNKSYKGLDANFLKSITELVDEFMTPSSIQGQF